MYLVSQENAFKEKDKTSSEDLVDGLVSAFLEDEVLTSIEFGYDFTKKYIETIKLEDINAAAKALITDDNRAVVLMAPEKDKDKLPSAEKIKELLNNTGKDVTAYVDQSVQKPLIEKLQKGSKVVATKQIPEIGVTELTLGNGVKVVVKSTDFKTTKS
jgi:zinc protease